MAADLEGIKYFLQGGDRRRGPCFGAPDTNPTFPEPSKENREFADKLVDELRAGKLTPWPTQNLHSGPVGDNGPLSYLVTLLKTMIESAL